ncbi:MAG: TonB-dependent receptor [Cellvibrionaceae bacterium]|nr:TonB-dependent receptor [Cellvibrionaceae bacterium]MCV6624643.1 TonB-dependent receptor [Cellvibrionaceae bacterium]
MSKPLYLTALLLASQAQAVDEILEFELPLVVSASRITQTALTSPAAITVIDKHMIAASPYNDIADLLRLVPGFQVAKADGRTFSVNSHGGGWEYANRMQVLVNGRSTYLPTLSVVDWDNLGVHIQDIERIEIVRGPSASAYGSNSFSAAINIITKAAAIDEAYNISTRVGNNGEREVLGRYAGRSEQMDYRLSLWKRRNNGLDSFHDFRDHNNFSFSARTDLRERGELDVEFNLFKGKTGAGEFDLLERVDRQVQGFGAKVAWAKNVSASEELKLQLYYNYRNDDDLSQTIPLADIFGVSQQVFEAITGADDVVYRTGYNTHRARRLDFETLYSWFKDSGFKAVAGLGIRQDFLKSVSYFPQKGEVEETSLRGFANVQQPLLKGLLLNAGVLYELPGDDSGHWSPRLSLNWSFQPQQSFRMSVSKAYRMPSLLEANFFTETRLSNGFIVDKRYYTDRDISAEQLLSYSLGYQGKYRAWQWELNLYKEEYDHMIDYVIDYNIMDLAQDHASRVGNYDSYDAYGVEGEVIYRPQLDQFIRLHFNRGKSLQKSLHRFNYNGVPERYRYYRDRAPENSVGLLAVHKFGAWQFSLGAQYMGAVHWDGFGDRVKSYSRYDASVQRYWAIGQQQLKLKLGALSFGGHYHEFHRELEVKPEYYLSLCLSGRE